MLLLISQFKPILKKYARLLNYEDSYNDLVVLFIESIMRTNLERIKLKSEGVIVNYIAKAVYHSYCKLVREAVENRISSCSLEELSNYQIYSSASNYPQFPKSLELPSGVLTQHEWLILMLIYDNDFSVAQIAGMLHVSRQSINQTKLRAESKLRKYYEKADE